LCWLATRFLQGIAQFGPSQSPFNSEGFFQL